jgi:small subunit ribosomal protein S2
MQRELTKLRAALGGIQDMDSYPKAGFIIDPKREEIAVREFRRLEIPIVAVTDTNCDPDLIDYIIPGNDDAIRAIKLFSSKIADACLEGMAQQEEEGDVESEKLRESGQVLDEQNESGENEQDTVIPEVNEEVE